MAGLTGNARKIADLFWAGKETAYAVRVETSAPRCFGQSEAWRGAMVVDSGSREGHAWDSRKIDFFVKNVVPFELLWRSGVEIEVVATESANRANTSHCCSISGRDGSGTAPGGPSFVDAGQCTHHDAPLGAGANTDVQPRWATISGKPAPLSKRICPQSLR